MAGNAEILRRAHEAFSAGDFSASSELVAPQTQVVDHGRGQTMTTREEFRKSLEAFGRMSSDMKLVDGRYLESGEWVTAQFRAVGTQDGPMENFPASNKPYSLDVCEVWHFNERGQADEGHNYSDGLGLLMQLGHIHMPAGA